LDADYPFQNQRIDLSSFSFLPLGTAVNRVPPYIFIQGVVEKALGTSRQFKYVADIYRLAGSTLFKPTVANLDGVDLH